MSKAFLGLLLMGLLVADSCHKGPPAYPGGSWTFKGVTYPATSCVGSDSLFTLTADDSTALDTAGSVTVAFFNTLPVGNGTYTVVHGSYPNTPYQVAIIATVGSSVTGLSYQSTGGNGSQTVHVSLSNGYIIVAGSGIEMYNTADPSDTAALSLNITQLQ